MPQEIIFSKNACERLGEILEKLGVKKYMLVCGSSFDKLPIKPYFDGLKTPFVRFGGFSSDMKNRCFWRDF